MAVHTGTELKKNLRRDVVDQVALQKSTQGPTGSRVGSQPFLVHERLAEGARHHAHVTVEKVENRFRPKSENMSKLREIFNSVMERTNMYKKSPESAGKYFSSP